MSGSNSSKPPYKTPNNRWLTNCLFYERVYDTPLAERVEGVDAVFSLNHDKPGLINCRKTFVEMGDPTGYRWAMQYLGDYDHWRALMKRPWFRDALNEWIEELNAKLLGEAIDTFRLLARTGSTETIQMQAAKYLAEQPWNKAQKGRPSKATVEAAIKTEVRKKTEEDTDAERIGLRLIK